jgi:hypothetical protein
LKWLQQRWFETINQTAEVGNLCCANFYLPHESVVFVMVDAILAYLLWNCAVEV